MYISTGHRPTSAAAVYNKAHKAKTGELSGSHSDEYEDDCLLRYSGV
jgi:hypothetical protein